jgi:hypothetical protein
MNVHKIINSNVMMKCLLVQRKKELLEGGLEPFTEGFGHWNGSYQEGLGH